MFSTYEMYSCKKAQKDPFIRTLKTSAPEKTHNRTLARTTTNHRMTTIEVGFGSMWTEKRSPQAPEVKHLVASEWWCLGGPGTFRM